MTTLSRWEAGGRRERPGVGDARAALRIGRESERRSVAGQPGERRDSGPLPGKPAGLRRERPGDGARVGVAPAEQSQGEDRDTGEQQERRDRGRRGGCSRAPASRAAQRGEPGEQGEREDDRGEEGREQHEALPRARFVGQLAQAPDDEPEVFEAQVRAGDGELPEREGEPGVESAEPERHQNVDAQRPATQARETGEQGRGEGAQSAVGETQEESEEGEDDESAGRRRRRHQPEAAGPEEQCGIEQSGAEDDRQRRAVGSCLSCRPHRGEVYLLARRTTASLRVLGRCERRGGGGCAGRGGQRRSGGQHATRDRRPQRCWGLLREAAQ